MSEAAEVLILSPEELAAATGGVWSTPAAGPITRLALNPQSARRGDLLVTTNREQWRRVKTPSESPQTLERLVARGAAGAVVRETADLDAPLPLLRVADTYRALEAIAEAARDKAPARRLLVTGTEGKTGFKVLFHHLASGQVAVNARLDSNNMERGICSSLANTRPHHALTVIEVAVPRLHYGERRARLVRPELCVITEIGYEHLTRHGSRERLIEAKASVVTGLTDDGRCLVRSDPRYFDVLRAAIRARREVPLVTFGDRPGDFGRLLDAVFDPRREGWAVAAEIDGERVDYFLPLVEGHAPMSSVGVLAAMALMGVPVESALERFATVAPHETSGSLYRLPVAGGTCRVYDQSHRCYLLGVEDFFRTAARLTAGPGGRKRLVLGHLYDEREYGPLVWRLLPVERLRRWIAEAGFDEVHTVGERAEFAPLLEGGSLSWEHWATPEAVVEPLRRRLRPEDLLLVKGDRNERMYVITQRLREPAGEGSGG
ncbi:Mur ligase family protein [Endothiovibrio diazotrophicus]